MHAHTHTHTHIRIHEQGCGERGEGHVTSANSNPLLGTSAALIRPSPALLGIRLHPSPSVYTHTNTHTHTHTHIIYFTLFKYKKKRTSALKIHTHPRVNSKFTHTSAYISIRQHANSRPEAPVTSPIWIRQHTSACVSMSRPMSAYKCRSTQCDGGHKH